MRRLLVLFFKVFSSASKAFLVFGLAYFLTDVDFAYYVLIAAAISYAIYFVGADYYINANRALIISTDGNTLNHTGSMIIRNQFAFYLFSSPVVVSAVCMVFYFGVLDWDFLFLFVLILYSEHFSQEVFRIYMSLSMQVLASFILFVRLGLWPLIVLLLMYIDPQYRTLYVPLYFWSGFSFLSFLFGALLLRNYVHDGGENISFRYMVNSLKISLPFLIGTIAIRAIFSADKFIHEYINGIESLVYYGLFFAMAGIPFVVLESLVFSFSYQKIVKFYNAGDRSGFFSEIKIMFISLCLIFFLFISFFFFFLDYILYMIGKESAANFSGVFYLFFSAFFVYALSFIPHYVLYAAKFDSQSVLSQVIASMCFFIFVFLFHSNMTFL